MESLESLKQRKQELESELKKITVQKHGSTPWNPGVTDQYKSESYTYNEYTDVSRANYLKSKIEYLQEQIRTYAERAQAERERAEFIKESQIPKYEYIAGGQKNETKNPAIAARYDAQHRFFEQNKLQQTIYRITGQKRKFDRLFLQGVTPDPKEQMEVAEELNKMFR